MAELAPLHSAKLSSIGGVDHGFFTRLGGVSTGIYAGLNVGRGSEDDRAAVEENRRRVLGWLGGDHLVTLYQVHSPKVVEVAGPLDGARPEADAMVTRAPGLALAILTADCAPVLFADDRARVIGAAHSGWRGAFGGVLEATVEKMVDEGATIADITAVVGPTIAQASYEVGPEVRDAFLTADASFSRHFLPSRRDGRFMFDLPGLVAAKLAALGIGAVDIIARDTYAEDDLFFSYRRATHRGEPDYGRQISAIMLRPQS